jgi:hypothetical protein
MVDGLVNPKPCQYQANPNSEKIPYLDYRTEAEVPITLFICSKVDKKHDRLSFPADESEPKILFNFAMDTLWLISIYQSWSLPKTNLLPPGETVEKKENTNGKGKSETLD